MTAWLRTARLINILNNNTGEEKWEEHVFHVFGQCEYQIIRSICTQSSLNAYKRMKQLVNEILGVPWAKGFKLCVAGLWPQGWPRSSCPALLLISPPTHTHSIASPSHLVLIESWVMEALE